MATDLGKVGMVSKGAWSSTATYEVLDTVYYNSTTYIAKQAVPANTLPTNTTYWQPALELPATIRVNIGLAAADPNYSGTLNLRKSGEVVSINFYDLKATSATTISGIIPEAYRPSSNAYRGVIFSTSDGPALVLIETNGNMSFTGLTVNKYYYGSITYVI